MYSANHDGFGASLNSLPWNQLAPGLRDKVYETRQRRFRILEFSEPFEEPDWCIKGHAGYVLEGEIVVNVDGRSVTFRAGDVIDLPVGTRHKHDRTVQAATLFLVEDQTEST